MGTLAGKDIYIQLQLLGMLWNYASTQDSNGTTSQIQDSYGTIHLISLTLGI